MVTFNRDIPTAEKEAGEALPTVLLRDEDIKVQRQADGRLLVSAQATNGYREWHFYRRCED